MKLCTSWIAGVLVVLAVGLSTANAVDQYWDINGTTIGATDDGNGIASGATTGSFWNSDPLGGAAGTIGTFTVGNRAVFSAGTNATASSALNGFSSIVGGNVGAAAYGGILVEEGEINFNGTMSMANAAIVEVAAGAMITQSGVNVTATAPNRFTFQLDGITASLKHTNTGFAGSFVSLNSDVNLNGGGRLEYTTANQLIIMNPTTAITGTGDLIKEGPGTIAIAGAGSYTGNTIINNGEIRIRTTANRLPITTNVIVNSPGVLNLNGLAQEIASLSGNGDVGIAGTTSIALTISGANSTTYTGALKDIANAGGGGGTVGVGRLIKNGAGVITFAGQNTITGTVTLNSGGIIVDTNGSLSGAICDVVMVGGTLTLNNAAQSVENFGGSVANTILNGTILTIDPAGSATVANNTYSGAISGTGGVRKLNTIAGGVYKTLTLSGPNTYQGGTEVSGGRLNSNSATGTGSGAVTVNGNGVLGGNGHVTGAITVQSGGSLSGGVGLGDGSSLTVDSTADIQTGGGLNFVIGGRVGDYNNNGVVDGGDYVVWRNAAAGETLPNDVTPGAVDASDYTQIRNHFGKTDGNSDLLNVTAANGLSLAAGSLLTVTAGPVAPIPGTYTVLKYNTGHTGTLASMLINNATGMELVSVVDNTTAKTFEVTISSTAQTRSWTDSVINGDWSADPADAGNWTPSGQPNGPGAVGTFAGTNAHVVTIEDSDKTLGTMTLNNASGYTIDANGVNQMIMNTFTGGAAINATSGAHSISARMTLLKSTTATVSPGADLSLSGEITNASGLVKAGAGTMSSSGVIRSTGTLGVTGGTLSLSGASTYSGATSISAGAILNANNTGTTSATGTSAVTVNGTLNNNGRITGATTVPTGGIENVASGATATGAHTVSGGTVNVAGTISGAMTVTANGVIDMSESGILTGLSTLSGGGVLRGTGADPGRVAGITLNATGHLAPGDTGIGSIGNFFSSGAVTFGATSVFDVDIGGAGNDTLYMSITTALTFGLAVTSGATIVVNDAGGMVDGSYPIIVLAGATNAALANWTSVTGPAGHTYSVGLSGSQILLNVAPAGSGSGLEGGAVPEPTTLGLVTLALAAFATSRRNRRV